MNNNQSNSFGHIGPSSPAISGEPYASPHIQLLSLIPEGLVCTSDGETEGTNPDGPGF